MKKKVINGMDIFSWGPDRELYREGDFIDYPCLNSITDAGMGDERNFVRVREVGSSILRTDAVEVEPGKSYEVYIYFRNDATSATAEGVRARSYFSAVIDGDHPGKVMGEISAKNSTPERVWDGARFLYSGDGAVELRYVNESAIVRTSGRADALALSAGELFTNTGALLGYTSLDGVLQAGAEYAGYISYEVRAVNSARTDFSTTYGTIFATTSGSAGVGNGGIVAPADDMPNTGIGGWGMLLFAMGLGVTTAVLAALIQIIVRKIGKGKLEKNEG